MNTNDTIKALQNNASQPLPLTGNFYLFDNGERTQITEATVRELIAKWYGEAAPSFPHCDGATMSLGTNQCICFNEARIAASA